jgi:putative ABC transport system permease protein
MTSELPLADFDRRGFHIRDRRPQIPSDVPSADTYSVSPDYFRVMKIPLRRGRLFTEADARTSPLVAIISETCAREQFPGGNAIGKQIQLGGRDDQKPWASIVGVVGDVHQYGLEVKPNIAAYIVQSQDLSFGYSLVARTAGDPRLMELTVRAAFLAVDPTQPVFRVRPMEAYLGSSLAERRFTLGLIALFGGLALLLAGVGIYGVMAYAVTLRTREIGIRMALGAERREVLAMVLRAGARLTAAGLAIGFVSSLAISRLLASLLFEVSATDLATSAAVALVLSMAALVASYLPARRAAQVDPMIALRYE